MIINESFYKGFGLQMHKATAIVRTASKIADLKPIKVIEKDIMSITYEDLKDDDAIIDAYGVFDPEHLYMYKTTYFIRYSL